MSNDQIFGSISDPEKYVYHYTKTETALNHILKTGKLRFGLFANVNDPRESKDWRFSCSIKSAPDPGSFQDIFRQATDFAKRRCKVLCMSTDDPTVIRQPIDTGFRRGWGYPRMWDRYAASHTGVCLIFDRYKLDQAIRRELNVVGEIYDGKIRYENISRDIMFAFHLDYDEIYVKGLEYVLTLHIAQHYHALYFRKAEDWSTEHEWRWLIVGKDDNMEFVSIQDSLLGMVLGVDFDAKYYPEIEDYVQEYHLSLGRVDWNNGAPMVVPALSGDAWLNVSKH